MSAETDLLPCPFCGSENIDPKGWASTDSAGPACDDCGASAGGVCGTLQHNIAAWNRRAQSAEIEALREALAALKAENEMLREVLKEADDELDRLDEDMDTCDHSVGVCMCSYWNMRREMKAARGKGGLSND